MKKILFIFFILIICVDKSSYSQSWARPGAIWHYNFYNIFPQSSGYIKIENLGDSVVGSKTCDKLQVFYKWWSFMNNKYDSTFSYEFTYENSDTVYYFSKQDNAFYVLYNFNGQPGDSCVISSNCVSGQFTDTIKIDSTGYTIINGDTLKHLWTSICSNPNGYQFWDKIVERIGCFGYMFPWPNCFLDAPGPPTLRCYSDSTGWSYQADLSVPCNAIYDDLVDIEFFSSISILPNPVTGSFQLIINSPLAENAGLEIFDVTGRLLHKSEIRKSDEKITVSDFSNGTYYLKISSEGKSTMKKFVKM